MEQLPENAGYNYDPANIYAVGIKNPDEIYQMIKDKVAYAHFKDFVTIWLCHEYPSFYLFIYNKFYI